MNKEKGITLIALITTIIILLIIAGVTIGGTIRGIDESQENKLFSELKMVQHAIIERKTKYDLTGQEEVLRGTKINSISDIDNVCLHFNDKERFLFLKYNGDISDVVLTIHELIHYISFEYDNVREALPMVREFPSIFYELYSLYYLSTLGYDKEIIKGINNNRLFDIYSSIDESKDINDYLNIYINDGKIIDYINKNK